MSRFLRANPDLAIRAALKNGGLEAARHLAQEALNAETRRRNVAAAAGGSVGTSANAVTGALNLHPASSKYALRAVMNNAVGLGGGRVPKGSGSR